MQRVGAFTWASRLSPLTAAERGLRETCIESPDVANGGSEPDDHEATLTKTIAILKKAIETLTNKIAMMESRAMLPKT